MLRKEVLFVFSRKSESLFKTKWKYFLGQEVKENFELIMMICWSWYHPIFIHVLIVYQNSLRLKNAKKKIKTPEVACSAWLTRFLYCCMRAEAPWLGISSIWEEFRQNFGITLLQWSARVVFSISRREWEFLWFNLAHGDQAPAGSRIFNPGISGTGFCKIEYSRL